jgi:hypothetical protein
LKPFCGQNIVIAVLSYEFDNSTSRRTESELTASKKSHRCSRLAKPTSALSVLVPVPS